MAGAGSRVVDTRVLGQDFAELASQLSRLLVRGKAKVAVIVTFVDAVILVAIPALIIEGVVVGGASRSGDIQQQSI